MGCVTDLTTTGDNDEEIDPVDYYRHYMYCDKCGSFKIQQWLEPENHLDLFKTQERLGKASTFFLSATIFFFIMGCIVGAPDLFSGGLIAGEVLDFILTVLLFSGPTLIFFFVLMRQEDVVGSKIHNRGVRCGQCGEEYETGNPFFDGHDQNPRNYSMEDVPLPRNTTYWIRGKTVER